MGKVYIIGHKHPDTDAICSVIGYADLLNHFEPGKYIPARCGDMNSEASFVLTTFEIDPPLYIENVEPRVSDVKFSTPISAKESVPTVDVAFLMEKHDIKNVPITDEDGKLIGLVSERGLAKAYVRKLKIEQLQISPIKLETLSGILNAKIIVKANEILDGKVYTAIDALHVALSKLTPGDIAIVGDNEPDQLAFINLGIAALVIANGAPIGERVINEAKKRRVSILSTDLDAFGVGKMINLSLPANMIMATDVPMLKMEDSMKFARKVVYESKFRTACVVDENERLIGVITRTTLLQDVKKSVILLDHNEYDQAVDGIDGAEIIEIIDHHRIGTISTLKPVKFLNDPIGSTSTIITLKFIEAGIDPDSKIAGILLSGILSDTLVMKLSTTTSKDLKAVEYLSKIAGVDSVEYGTKLIKAGMALDGLSMSEILTRDMKRYNLFGKNIIVSQVMIPSFDITVSRREEILFEMEKIKDTMRVDGFFTMFTNIFEQSTDLFTIADKEYLLKFGTKTQPLRLNNVMSRKKDFLPQLGQMLRTI